MKFLDSGVQRAYDVVKICRDEHAAVADGYDDMLLAYDTALRRIVADNAHELEE